MGGEKKPPEAKHIVAKPIHSVNENKITNRDLWARVAYYYPQYTLKEASKLSVRDINLLLKTARRIEAEKMYNLTQIVASPHTEKGKGVKSLTQHFEQEMNK